MSKIITIGALLAVSAATWQLGASISHEAVNLALGVLLGSMFGGGLLAVAVSAPKRIDIFHHNAPELSQKPTQLVAQQERFIVLDNVKQLTTAHRARIEVSR